MFCCSTLKWHCEFAGESGITFLVIQYEHRIGLVVQSRITAVRYETEMFEWLWKTKPPCRINDSMEIGTPYCPFCGCEFEKTVRRNRQFFVELAKKHEPFARQML